MENNRHLKQLVICLEIINKNIEIIQRVWEKEFNENDGFLSENIKNCIDKIPILSTNLLSKYKHIVWNLNEHQSTIKNIYSFMCTNNSSKKQKSETYGYNFKEERNLLPTRLLDSTVSMSYAMNYIANKLQLTIERQNIEKEIGELFDYIRQYTNFTEEELILNKYKI